VNSEGEVIKRVLLSALSTFPPIKPRIQPNRVNRVVSIPSIKITRGQAMRKGGGAEGWEGEI
jgi:hypothetical protein